MTLWLLFLLACSSADPLPETADHAIAVAGILNEGDAQALLEELDGQRFKSAARRDPAHARLFLGLAALDTTDHRVAAAALEGMEETWSDKDGGDKPLADEDYARVVLAYLDHAEPVLQARAVGAAKHLLRQGHEPVIAKLIALSELGPAHRFAALESLSQVPDWGKREDIAAVYVAALDGATPYNTSQALFRIETKAYSFALKAEAAPKARKLLSHEDPGVRGRAALVFAGLKKDASAAASAVGPLLADEHAFVRSSAARAAGSARLPGLAPAVMGLLDDTAANTHDITGWKRLDGSPGKVHHDGSAWSRVDDAALSSLQMYGGVGGVSRLELTTVRHDQVEADLTTRKREARAWYAANKSKLAPG